MDEEKIVTTEEQKDVGAMTNDELKGAVSKTLEKIRTQALLLGSQAMCSTILQKITEFERMPGKRTLNDHRRLVKDIKEFCQIGLSRKVNLDGTTSEISDEETTVESAES